MREKKQTDRDQWKMTTLHFELLEFRFRFGIISSEPKSVMGSRVEVNLR